jgi:hypothetical protein
LWAMLGQRALSVLHTTLIDHCSQALSRDGRSPVKLILRQVGEERNRLNPGAFHVSKYITGPTLWGTLGRSGSGGE